MKSVRLLGGVGLCGSRHIDKSIDCFRMSIRELNHAADTRSIQPANAAQGPRKTPPPKRLAAANANRHHGPPSATYAAHRLVGSLNESRVEQAMHVRRLCPPTEHTLTPHTTSHTIHTEQCSSPMSMASPASAAFSSASSSSFRDFYQAGVAFQRGGRHAQASRCFRRALEGLDPHEQGKVLAFKALWNLSQASLALGDDAGTSTSGMRRRCGIDGRLID